MSFVHLHLHTEYSLKDGIVRIKQLMPAIKDNGMNAVAITDLTNLFGLVKFYQTALNNGVKPIIGSELYLQTDNAKAAPNRVVFLAQNQIGYRNLVELMSKAYTHGQKNGVPLLNYHWLNKESLTGIIVLSCGVQGDLGQAIVNEDRAEQERLIQFWLSVAPERFYIELQRLGKSLEELYISNAVELAKQHHIPVVASNNVHFIKEDDFEAHEARVCINQGRVLDDKSRPKEYMATQYLRSAEEMEQLFSDIPSAINNAVEIAKRCNVQLSLKDTFLPKFPTPDGISITDYLKQQANLGLEQRFHELSETIDKQRYFKRLEKELEVINHMGFAGYFLIVADFIQWAKKNEIPVGPGRGSGAGSIVAYVLGITDLDPIEYDLLFERFLNPERVSMPDFDIDFCMEGRDRVIEYVAERYGRDSVSQIITYGTMAAKAVVRDVGRVLGMPYGFVDKIAKLIPFDLGTTLSKALEQEPLLQQRYQEEDEVQTLLDLAKQLEGITRNAGKHAGGVVIAPSKLTDYCPLYCDENGENLVTQFDKDDVETIGLVKFDFLGLRTLTIIDWAVRSANKHLAADDLIDITKISLTDIKTFKLLQSCNTTAVFQLESRGMKELIGRLVPDCFEDIIALVALFRPGPLQSGMVDDFVNRKHGRASIDYPHPLLEPILKPTYGVILYQEQVMQIAQVLAKYSLGEADLLRRAMGKKKPEEMAKQRDRFVKGAAENNIDPTIATSIFDLMEKFAGYGFNKSHSAAYALIAYQTAWLKTHFPAHYMSAVMSADMQNTDKLFVYIDNCQSMDLVVEKPDINTSSHKFTVIEDNKISYGLGAIKGVGESAIENLVTVRQQGGEYSSLFEFCQRVELRKINRRSIEALICAGAMDSFGVDRNVLLASLDKAMKLAEHIMQDKTVGQQDLFAAQVSPITTSCDYVKVNHWDMNERLSAEKAALGFYLSGHPMEQYVDEFKYFTTSAILGLHPTSHAIVAGLVTAIRYLNTKRGDRMAILTISDHSGHSDVTLFPEALAANSNKLEKDVILIFEGEVSVDDFSGGLRITAEQVLTIVEAREKFSEGILLTLESNKMAEEFMVKLQCSLTDFEPGNCPITLQYRTNKATAKLALGPQWRFNPNDSALNKLKALFPELKVELDYSN